MADIYETTLKDVFNLKKRIIQQIEVIKEEMLHNIFLLI